MESRCWICSGCVDCQSWVYNRRTRICQLKNAYVPSENTIPCRSCMMFDHTKMGSAASPAATEIRSMRFVRYRASPRTWQPDSFGVGSKWSESTSRDICNFRVGFDQPAKYNYGSPKTMDSAFKCCNECKSIYRKHRYVFMLESWLCG